MLRTRLLELLRVHSYREGEFTLASGGTSKYYVDVRRTSLTAEGAFLIGELLFAAADSLPSPVEGAGGLTLGADPLATAISLASWRAGRPLSAFIVRKEAKGHGAGRRLEMGGTLRPGAHVVVLDDTVTTGGSTLDAVRAVRAEGFEVSDALCVVDRCEGGAEALAAEGVRLDSIFSLAELGAAQ